jgi:phage tail-like protein
MTPVEHRYRFGTAAQWRAGARRNLRLRGDRLVVPDQLAVEALDGTGPRDGGGLAATDACGREMWLRPSSGELVRRPPEGCRGLVELGRIDCSPTARRVIVGRTLMWVLDDRGLVRYHSATLQQLSSVDALDGWRISDAAGDGRDGIWVVEADRSGRWRLRQVDCWGRSCRSVIPIADADADELAVAATAYGRSLVVTEPVKADTARVFDTAAGALARSIDLAGVPGGSRTLSTAAPGDRIHLLTVVPASGPKVHDRAVYQALNLVDGDLEDHQDLEVPRSLGEPRAMTGGPASLLVACSRGMAVITERAAGDEQRLGTFITPALISPRGTPSGWNRADIDVTLPAGTAMDVTWAATDDQWLIDRAGQIVAGPATVRAVDELEQLLPWNDEKVTYRATGEEAEPETVAAVLGEVTETALWLRVQLRTPPARISPVMSGLRVLYPSASYLDDLPAIYQEQPTGTRALRRILAPYELLLGSLDETLADLPGRIDPATADSQWTDYLLSWLGFPPLGDLPAATRGKLLERASVILERRGTRAGLQELLDIVTEQRARIADSADETAGWFLGSGDPLSPEDAPVLLGVDTVALAQQPEPSRLGTMVIGRNPLGHGCPDPALTLTQRASLITITVELDPEEQAVLEPVIERLLPVFVPAQCRVKVAYTGSDGSSRTRQLDIDFRLGPADPAPEDTGGHAPYDALLHSDGHWRLGATTRLCEWALPERRLHPVKLDHGTYLGTGPRLQ